jgi:hypothetical protein
MKITLESTDKIVTLVDGDNELPARVWEGTTANGIPVHCFITRLAVRDTHDLSQFEQELAAQPPAVVSRDFDVIPNRLIL